MHRAMNTCDPDAIHDPDAILEARMVNTLLIGMDLEHMMIVRLGRTTRTSKCHYGTANEGITATFHGASREGRDTCGSSPTLGGSSWLPRPHQLQCQIAACVCNNFVFGNTASVGGPRVHLRAPVLFFRVLEILQYHGVSLSLNVP